MGICCGGIEGKEEIGIYIRDLDDLLWVLGIFPTPIVVECEVCGQLYVVYETECCETGDDVMVEESFCVGCGHVITIATVGCRVEGTFVLPSMEGGRCVLFYCKECWQGVVDRINGHMDKARKLTRELEEMDDKDSMGK